MLLINAVNGKSNAVERLLTKAQSKPLLAALKKLVKINAESSDFSVDLVFRTQQFRLQPFYFSFISSKRDSMNFLFKLEADLFPAILLYYLSRCSKIGEIEEKLLANPCRTNKLSFKH